MTLSNVNMQRGQNIMAIKEAIKLMHKKCCAFTNVINSVLSEERLLE